MSPPVARPVRRNRVPWLILGVFLCGLAASCAVGFVWLVMKTAENKRTESAAVEAARVNAEAITAVSLSDTYRANEVDGDERYKNRMLRVTGSVVSVSKDILDSPFVVIGEPFQFVKVQCFFGSGEAGLASLRPGDAVTISGLCEGKMLNVRLTHCRIEH